MKPDIYWINLRFPGRLAVMPRPRGNDWLEDEMRGCRQAGLDVVVSLLTDAENVELGLAEEAAAARAAGLQFRRLPILDRAIPPTREANVLAQDVASMLRQGMSVGAHCRMGIGRSAVIAAAALIVLGTDPLEALEAVRSARGCDVPDTEEQREWVLDFGKAGRRDA